MVPWGSYGISRSRCHSAADVLEQQQPALLVCAAAAVSRAAAAQSRGSSEGSGTSGTSGTLGQRQGRSRTKLRDGSAMILDRRP